MSEARLLALLSQYPHPAALARQIRDPAVFPALRSLECRGFVSRCRGLYRLTRAGRSELEMSVCRTARRARSLTETFTRA